MKLNKDWCLESYLGPSTNKFIYTSQNELYGTYQILINGHYLYGKNKEFRQAYLDTFNTELILPSKDLSDFLYQNNFNLMYFGLLAAPYIIAKGNSPGFYLDTCSADNSTLLSQFISEETMRLHRPIQPKPGMPGYYYREMRTKAFVNSFDGKMISFCPIKHILDIAIDFSKKLNEDAISYVNANPEDSNIREFLSILRDSSWSPLLNGK